VDEFGLLGSDKSDSFDSEAAFHTIGGLVPFRTQNRVCAGFCDAGHAFGTPWERLRHAFGTPHPETGGVETAHVTPGVTLLAVRVTLHVTPDLEAGEMMRRDLVGGRFPHQGGWADLERDRQPADGGQPRLTPGLEALDGVNADARQLGELALRDGELRTPVAEAGGGDQGGAWCHGRRMQRSERRCGSGGRGSHKHDSTSRDYANTLPFVVLLALHWWIERVLPMKVLLLSLSTFLGAGALAVPTAYAATRSPAEATAHALDELANLCAQRRPECPPMATWTPSPTSTNTPLPTDTPTPTPTASPTATAAQCWFTDQELGDPDNDHIVFDDFGAPIPCPTDDPTPSTADTPTPTPMPASPTSPAVVAPAPAASPPPEAPPAPTYTPASTYTPLPTYTPFPTWTPAPRPSASPTRGATSTPPPAPSPTVPVAAAASTPNAKTGPPDRAQASPLDQGVWDWGAFLKAAAALVLVGAALIWAVTRRRVVTWSSRRKGVSS
jgi:hypothetical protein